jgi:Flp pilus assembly protein TadG
MVEFTFTFMLLIVLLVAILVFGLIFYSYLTIVNAARDGTRFLYAHPRLPSPGSGFATADAEATYVITSSVSLLDWKRMTVNITPPKEDRIAGSWVAVEIVYNVPLPTIQLPMGFTGTTFTLVRPIELRALSRRSLD